MQKPYFFKPNLLISISFSALVISFFMFFPQKAGCVNQMLEERKELPWTIQVMFGIRGPKPLIWDGTASTNEGVIETIQSINFGEKDKIYPEEKKWKCSIDRLRGSEIADELGGISPREYLEERVAKGIFLDLHAPRTARVSVSTSGGVFSFALADVSFGKPVTRLDENVTIQLAPRSFLFGSPKTTNNYPALAMDSLDNLWAAWPTYQSGKERLVLQKYDGKSWGKEIEVDNKGCYLQPSLAGDLEGGLWVCWSGRVNGNWDIYARHLKEGKWSAVIRLTDHPAPDTHQEMVVDDNNRPWVCWQSFQFGNADILMKYYDQGRWSSALRITDDKNNDWQPTLCTDNTGNVYVAWDAYRNHEHQIILRTLNGTNLGQEVEVISSKKYVAHAALAADKQGHIWVAWDISEDDWGFGEDEEERYISLNKDEAIETQINYLKVPMEGRRGRYNSRQLGLVCYSRGKFYKPAEDLTAKLSSTMKIYADLPRLQIDAGGRLWLFYHHYIGKIPFYIHDKMMEIWKAYGICYDGTTWSSPIEFSHTTWRNTIASSVCLSQQTGEIWIAYAGDKRKNESRELEAPSICIAALNPAKTLLQHVSLVPWENQPKSVVKASTTKITAVPKKRYESNLGKEKYQLYWGTVHEQHDVRGRMAMDGFVVDAFKYALDDQQYDFLGVSDYAHRGTSWFSTENYSVWEARKAISVYTTRKDFISFYVEGASPYKRAPGHSLQKKPIPKGAPVITAAYVKDFTEESFVDALKMKRNYVATDWIVLDFSIEGYPMGEKFEGTNPHPRILSKIIGTDEIEQIDIIRNAKSIFSSKNYSGKDADITFVDMDLPSDKKDDYHYFIQVKQKNGGLAWTPPCCYHYKPTIAQK